jgi:hypothetical protein
MNFCEYIENNGQKWSTNQFEVYLSKNGQKILKIGMETYYGCKSLTKKFNKIL